MKKKKATQQIPQFVSSVSTVFVALSLLEWRIYRRQTILNVNSSIIYAILCCWYRCDWTCLIRASIVNAYTCWYCSMCVCGCVCVVIELPLRVQTSKQYHTLYIYIYHSKMRDGILFYFFQFHVIMQTLNMDLLFINMQR